MQKFLSFPPGQHYKFCSLFVIIRHLTGKKGWQRSNSFSFSPDEKRELTLFRRNKAEEEAASQRAGQFYYILLIKVSALISHWQVKDTFSLVFTECLLRAQHRGREITNKSCSTAMRRENALSPFKKTIGKGYYSLLPTALKWTFFFLTHVQGLFLRFFRHLIYAAFPLKLPAALSLFFLLFWGKTIMEMERIKNKSAG